MVYVRSPILIGDNQRKYSSHQPWIHGTSLMWALHVWFCVTDFSSLTALLGYLVTCKIRAHSPSPGGRYQIICNFVRTCYEPLDYANFIFDRCVAARLCQQTRFIVPVESAGANRVPIVPEDSGSHRHRDTNFVPHEIKIVFRVLHDDVIKWRHFPRYWQFGRGIHRSPLNSPHKGQGRWTLMFSLICALINGRVNNGEVGDLRCHRAHYDVIVMNPKRPNCSLCMWHRHFVKR